MRDVLRREPELLHTKLGAAPGIASTAEQRESARYTMLIRAAKLRCPAGEFLCIVRDASSSGVNIRLFHPLPENDRLMLELQNGDMHELELVWHDDDRAGLKFLAEANIARIIESPSRFTKRAIRINLETPARLASGAVNEPVTVHDISQQGAKITSATRFSIDQRVRLAAHGLPQVNAKIRWRRDESYGLVFEDTFQFGDLARIVAAIQLGAGPAGTVGVADSSPQKRVAC